MNSLYPQVRIIHNNKMIVMKSSDDNNPIVVSDNIQQIPVDFFSYEFQTKVPFEIARCSETYDSLYHVLIPIYGKDDAGSIIDQLGPTCDEILGEFEYNPFFKQQ